ncbi:ParB/RepB/Spo0J family partition protein [Sphingobium vermicomposti]|uniref:ParB family chromosome partitioning protein n=1 Tax=Sphingobium vermicomposti TaxID=529005 RepID=A0A846M336_9SPHN|nr:ParB/RepB/Spo0J family partition protein [Sphingobium vermicomposti]NIJ16003.1 ParB family chromosome partitioning protein [Sphingobium vermicomposti]
MSNEGDDKLKVGKRPHGLGRGLSALLGDVARETPVAPAAPAAASSKAIQNIEVALVQPHPEQPRRHFDEGALAELADSISKRGVIQPIIVRPHGGGFQIVAGERRWRAAQRAQLHRIPAIVRDFDEAETLEIALVENIQREDLNPIEEAEAYRKLIADFHHSQEALGRLVGKSRSHIANLMRLLDLPASVQQQVVEQKLSMGHARALIGAPDCESLAHTVATKGLSVRDTEQLVRRAKNGDGASPRAQVRPATDKDPDIAALEQHLADILGVRIDITHAGGGAGTLSLRYSTLDQLDMLCQRLSGERI